MRGKEKYFKEKIQGKGWEEWLGFILNWCQEPSDNNIFEQRCGVKEQAQHAFFKECYQTKNVLAVDTGLVSTKNDRGMMRLGCPLRGVPGNPFNMCKLGKCKILNRLALINIFFLAIWKPDLSK